MISTPKFLYSPSKFQNCNEVEGILKLLLPLVTSNKSYSSCIGIDVK
jgi:hypothetical protein